MRIHKRMRSRILIALLPVVLVSLVAGCGSKGMVSSGATASATAMPTSAAGAGGAIGAATVDIQNFAFTPKTVTVKTGATVTWTNKDSVPHNVTSTNGPGVNAATTSTFASKNLNRGQTFSFKFTKAGTYYYECTIHKAMPSMHAVIEVK